MASVTVRSCAQDMAVSVQTSPERRDLGPPGRDDTERESPSQPLVNFSADVTSLEEYSQAPTGGVQVAFSQQPSPELLMSLGIKVRDFAYENTLPAIAPVPRVPRQVQPVPRALKRMQRDWDDDEGHSDRSSLAQSCAGQMGSRKAGSLERKPTEPLQEPAIQHPRALERTTVKRLCSIITPSSRRILLASPRTRLSARPPTSPLTPPLSHPAPQESEFVQTPSTFPFIVHMNDTSTIPASQFDSESHPVSLHPVLYTTFTLESRTSGCSPAPSPPPDVSPAPLVAPFLELPSPIKESGADTRVRKRRGRGTVSTTPPNRYQLRQRPIPSPRASALSRCSHQTSSTPKPLARPSRVR